MAISHFPFESSGSVSLHFYTVNGILQENTDKY